MVRGLHERGLVRANYRGAAVAYPSGVVAVAAALVALGPLALVDELTEGDVFVETGAGGLLGLTAYVLGVALLGLLDDLAGSGDGEAPRGWRGHVRATASGGFSTGALKAAGALGLALLVLRGQGLETGEYLLAVAVLVLATNLFNLLDLRPGRSIKALLLLGGALSVGTLDLDPLWAVGLFLGPLIALLPFDLRELAMLGDTGSNAAGAVAGFWLVLTLSTTGQAIALVVILIATVYGEFRSISALIERTPGLRELDWLGRVRIHA
jgi:UDP-N-acetylmuramyl pentapeptide phosphotransferase/UDP-N-acetylglucosamine-1-phosphate transferase